MVVAFAILPFFTTLLGGTAAMRLRHRLHPFMAFAAGVLVATALADLLPEANDLVGAEGGALLPGPGAVIGFLAFSALEAFVHRETWEHGHQRLASSFEPGEPHEHRPAPTSAGSQLAIIGPASLIVHSTLDGLAIGVGFRAGAQIGLLVGLAVLAHDFADGMNVVTLSLSLVGGARVGLARGLLLLDALAPPVGAAIGTFIDGLTTIADQAIALRLVHFVDKLYDQEVRLTISTRDRLSLGDLFSPTYRHGGYEKKYRRCLSRLHELIAETRAFYSARD